MLDSSWQSFGQLGEFAGQESFVKIVDNDRILLLRTDEGWNAFSLRCPHKGGEMDERDLKGDKLACPLHGWLFDLGNDGVETHGYTDLNQYPTRIHNEELFVQLA